jgi:phosphoribosylaminoimidazolecarboxamide formyltransferase / IMP cyclohydrolase
MSMNYNCIEISNYTGFSEILEGRVKTLHPKIHAGILNIRKSKKHNKDVKEGNIPNIDLVIVDLYPFEEKLKEKLKFKKLIENIDIGGSALIRGAAKNFADVTVISSVNDYSGLVNELKLYKGSTSIKFRKLMSSKAFSLTSYYDSIISNWFNKQMNIKFPERKTLHGKLNENLRYGENPHQAGALYNFTDSKDLNKFHGKNLSYNNYNDIYCALNILSSFKKNKGSVIIKHANPCGVSIEQSALTSFKNALRCDPISAFGGVVAINSTISRDLALELNKIFFEVIVAKGFKKEAIKILKKKKNIRLIDSSKFNPIKNNHYLFLGNSFLAQESNDLLFNKKIKIVTRKKPSKRQLKDLKFAFNVCKFVKSNAIVLVNNLSTIGIGSGQPSRLDSCKISTTKAREFVQEKLHDSVASSDAFFPFPDGIKELVESGVKAIIQPGGSINDNEVIKIADEAEITMAFTGIRHFKH